MKPPKENTPGQRITECWLFIATDSDGDEGLPAFTGDDGLVYPLISTTAKNLPVLRGMARQIARERHCNVRLVHFTGHPETLETWTP